MARPSGVALLLDELAPELEELEDEELEEELDGPELASLGASGSAPSSRSRAAASAWSSAIARASSCESVDVRDVLYYEADQCWLAVIPEPISIVFLNAKVLNLPSREFRRLGPCVVPTVAQRQGGHRDWFGVAGRSLVLSLRTNLLNTIIVYCLYFVPTWL